MQSPEAGMLAYFQHEVCNMNLQMLPSIILKLGFCSLALNFFLSTRDNTSCVSRLWLIVMMCNDIN